MVDQPCPVCLEPLQTVISVNLPCGSPSHVLCMSCFLKLHTRTCPLCRASFEHVIPDIEGTTRVNLIEFLTESAIEEAGQRGSDDDVTRSPP